jgi:hypothetical protein
MAQTRAIACLISAALASLCVACGSAARETAANPPSGATRAHTIPTPPAARRRDRVAQPNGWLGLNFNSGTGAQEYVGGSGAGTLRQFSAHGVVYDRLGDLEIAAGSTISNFPSLRLGLRVSVRAGMVPDVLVDPGVAPNGCTTDPEPKKLCLPVTPAQIRDYVNGFVATVRSVLTAYPRSDAAFEPMNEPWDWAFPPGTSSGQIAARQYARLLKSLLPAVARAGIPLSSIYVPTTGALTDGSSWVKDLYAAQPCLRPGRDTCGPIEGWNAHPYGLPTSGSSGISSVPKERAVMRSGEDNIIISEVGFCSNDVDRGQYCDLNLSQVDGTNAQTSQWLSETLREAGQMHRAGWLRALIVWARAFGGWSMQTARGQLTAQGQVLMRFAAGNSTDG